MRSLQCAHNNTLLTVTGTTHSMAKGFKMNGIGSMEEELWLSPGEAGYRTAVWSAIGLLATPSHARGSDNTHICNLASTRTRRQNVNQGSLCKNKVNKWNAYVPWASRSIKQHYQQRAAGHRSSSLPRRP